MTPAGGDHVISAGSAWVEDYQRLSHLDPVDLSAEELEALADAAWLLCRLDESTAARQQSYVRYLEAGDHGPAARAAWRMFWEHLYAGETAVSMGWLRRARRHLAVIPESAEHGFVALADAELALSRGDLDEGAASAMRAVELGSRHGAQGIEVLGLTLLGRILVAQGDQEEGLASFDEAMTLALSGRLDDYFAGAVYCALLAECREIADIRRGSEWTSAARTWCASLPATTPFHGICRIHRGEILCLRGDWEEAEQEIRAAGDELAAFKPRSAGEAFYVLGDLHRRRGDIAAAEGAFLRAHQLGRDPQPGLALVRLAQGQVAAASATLQAALADLSASPMARARLLAVQVEAALQAGELSRAEAAATDLCGIAAVLDRPRVHATAQIARGGVRLAREDLPGAITDLRSACACWGELGLPYEEAQARLLIGIAVRALGDQEGAAREIETARRAFRALGARADVERANQLLRRTVLPAGLTSREADVLRLVASGKTNRDIAAELVISEHTVARHVQNIFTKLGVSSRAAATAFAVAHRL